MKFPAECDGYEKIVVTRHEALVEYLIEIGFVEANVKATSHVTVEEIENKHVIGVLPYYLASKAAVFTEIPMRIPYDKRHKELTKKEIAFYMQEPHTYEIKELQ